MSTVKLTIQGRLSAFHASRAGGLVICFPLDDEGASLPELAQIHPGQTVEVVLSVEIEDGSESLEAEAEEGDQS